MSDFVEMSMNKYWPHLPDPPLLDDSRLGPMAYQQDTNDSEVVKARQAEARDNVGDRYATTKEEHKDIALKNSVLWFSDAMTRKDPIPFTLALVAIVATPIVDSGATSGQGIVVGYFAGLVANYCMLKAQGTKAKTVDGLN